MSKQSITRRVILTGLAAAPVAACAPNAFAGQSGDDAELLAMFAEWQELQALENDLWSKYSAASEKARSEYPKIPSIVTRHSYPDMKPRLMSEGNVIAQYNRGPEDWIKERRSELMNIINNYQAKCDAIFERIAGELSRAHDETTQKRYNLEEAIKEKPSQSVTGIFIKMQIWMEILGHPKGHEHYDNLLGEVFEDAKRLSAA